MGFGIGDIFSPAGQALQQGFSGLLDNTIGNVVNLLYNQPIKQAATTAFAAGTGQNVADMQQQAAAGSQARNTSIQAQYDANTATANDYLHNSQPFAQYGQNYMTQATADWDRLIPYADEQAGIVRGQAEQAVKSATDRFHLLEGQRDQGLLQIAGEREATLGEINHQKSGMMLNTEAEMANQRAAAFSDLDSRYSRGELSPEQYSAAKQQITQQLAQNAKNSTIQIGSQISKVYADTATTYSGLSAQFRASMEGTIAGAGAGDVGAAEQARTQMYGQSAEFGMNARVNRAQADSVMSRDYESWLDRAEDVNKTYYAWQKANRDTFESEIQANSMADEQIAINIDQFKQAGLTGWAQLLTGMQLDPAQFANFSNITGNSLSAYNNAKAAQPPSQDNGFDPTSLIGPGIVGGALLGGAFSPAAPAVSGAKAAASSFGFVPHP